MQEENKGEFAAVAGAASGLEPGHLLIKTAKDAVEWILLAYSLGHADNCPCDNCNTARPLAMRVGQATAQVS
jgi:hypothetical protein